MKITATALDSFAHGCKKYTTGNLVEALPGEIDDLRKAGLVGGEKMADEVENKMAPAPTNKKAR